MNENNKSNYVDIYKIVNIREDMEEIRWLANNLYNGLFSNPKNYDGLSREVLVDLLTCSYETTGKIIDICNTISKARAILLEDIPTCLDDNYKEYWKKKVDSLKEE